MRPGGRAHQRRDPRRKSETLCGREEGRRCTGALVRAREADGGMYGFDVGADVKEEEGAKGGGDERRQHHSNPTWSDRRERAVNGWRG